MEALIYKGYQIVPAAFCCGYEYYPQDYQGEIPQWEGTVDDCKDAIDCKIFEKTYKGWEVQLAENISPVPARFTWLSDAVKFACAFPPVKYNLNFDSI